MGGAVEASASAPPMLVAAGNPAQQGSGQAPRELEEDARRLRLEIQALTRQRDSLEKEAAKPQNHVEAVQKKGSTAGASRSGNALLEQKFEAALQMIGRLNEDLEACKA